LRTRKIWSFIVAGFFFGLGFYTYTSFRMAVLILPFVLIPYWFVYKKESLQKQFLLSIFYFLFSIFLIALPLAIYFIQHPQDFISRATPVSVFSAQNPLKEFGKSLISHLGMFNFYGDPNWRHNFSGYPELFLPVGILFLIGAILSFMEIFRKSNYQNRDYQKLSTFYFLLSTFFIMLLPGILTFEGIPHSLRVIGTMPAVFIFSGIGAWKLYEFLNDWNDRKNLLIYISFLFLFAVGFSEFNKYLNFWAKESKVKEAFTENYYDIGNFLNNLPGEVNKYVIVNEPGNPLYGISIPAQTPIFIESAEYGKPRAAYLKFEDLDQIKTGEQETIIVPLYDDRTFEELSKRFPQGQVEKENTFEYYETY
jgi:uncharacterized membrane protein